MPGVTRYDIDHLRDTVDANRALRLAAVPHVERIVAEEVERFLEWMSGRQVIPTIVNLRREAERVANIELTRTMRRLDGVDARVEHEVAHLAHRIVAKLLHQPTVRLKALAANDDGVAYAAMLQELFALTPAPVESPVDGSRGAVSHD